MFTTLIRAPRTLMRRLSAVVDATDDGSWLPRVRDYPVARRR